MSRHLFRSLSGLLLFALLPFAVSAQDYSVNFIHRSTGGMWLLEGDLRSALGVAGYTVHDSNGPEVIPCELPDCPYSSGVDPNTFPCHWPHWFTYHMDALAEWECAPPATNNIIMFKSCFPASNIGAEGTEPGDPEDCSQTIWNYKATFNAILSLFEARPEILFVAVTAPPRSDRDCGGYPCSSVEDASRAREFNNWLKTEWATGVSNVTVFDFFDVLTKHGDSGNFLHPDYYWEDVPNDDHPGEAGLEAATAEFLPFLEAAIDDWTNCVEDWESM